VVPDDPRKLRSERAARGGNPRLIRLDPETVNWALQAGGRRFDPGTLHKSPAHTMFSVVYTDVMVLHHTSVSAGDAGKTRS